MERFVRNGVEFSTFVKNGERFLCTGSPTGRLKLAYVGELADYCTVEGATSVVSGDMSCDELYEKWLEATAFYRSIGIAF